MIEGYFTTEEAAEYLGMTEKGVRYHVYTSKKLTGQKFGRDLFFSRDELDAFLKQQRVRRAPGTPQSTVTPGEAADTVKKRRHPD